jgi:hypothetical protein
MVFGLIEIIPIWTASHNAAAAIAKADKELPLTLSSAAHAPFRLLLHAAGTRRKGFEETAATAI